MGYNRNIVAKPENPKNNFYKIANMITINFNDDKIEVKHPDSGGGMYYYYQGQPFTGIFEEFYANGNLIGEITVVDGHVNGRQTQYYENGQLKEEYFEKFNSMYNTYKYWDQLGHLTLHIIHDDEGNEIERVVG